MQMLCVVVGCTPSSNSECGVFSSLLMFVSDAGGDHYGVKHTRVWVLN